MLCSVGWFSTDVSGLPIGPIVKCQVSNMGPICSPKVSVPKQPKMRNNTSEDHRIEADMLA